MFGARIASAVRAAKLPMPTGAPTCRAAAATAAADPERILALRRLVGRSLGPVRNGRALSAALAEVASVAPESCVEEDLATVARLLLRAALERRESRGAHYRTDYPMRGTPHPVTASRVA